MVVPDGIPDNAVVEWFDRSYGLAVGLTSNAPLRRRIGRVVCHKADYLVVQPADADGLDTIRLAPDRVTAVVAEQAEAGWANLA